MRRPTVKQLNDVRFVCGNGWGDGDILEYFPLAKDKRRVRQSLISFEKWIEELQGQEFECPII